MNWNRYLSYPSYSYQKARGLNYSLQYFALNGLSHLVPLGAKARPFPDAELVKLIKKESDLLFEQDSQNIAEGIYPISVLTPEKPSVHIRRLPRILVDSLRIQWRRAKNKTQDFDQKAAAYAENLPDYFTRNFHFQTDGYLSEESARIYDHQVEMLFGGTANAMRRILLRPMKEYFQRTLGIKSVDGHGLSFLEVGAGTGSMARFVRLAFPRARIVVTDLSHPYLKVAQTRLRELADLDFIQADGSQLPFRDKEFDAVYSVFLFHELPMSVRKQVLTESRRVLKSSGFFGLVDSIQKGEVPAFDPLLHDFPIFFHEPFYKNYSLHPMEALVEECGFTKVETGRGYVSKYVTAVAP